MPPAISALFLSEIMPRIIAVIGRMVPSTTEDHAELIQDAAAMAAANVVQLVNAGKEVKPSTVAYFTLKRLQNGRRSTGTRRADVLFPGSGCQVVSLDAPLDSDDPEAGSLHDVLDARRVGTAELAQRYVDWSELIPELGEKQREVLNATAMGKSGKATAYGLKVSPPRVVQVKREVAAKIRSCWGEDVLVDAQRKPLWRRARGW